MDYSSFVFSQPTSSYEKYGFIHQYTKKVTLTFVIFVLQLLSDELFHAILRLLLPFSRNVLFSQYFPRKLGHDLQILLRIFVCDALL